MGHARLNRRDVQQQAEGADSVQPEPETKQVPVLRSRSPHLVHPPQKQFA